MADVDFSHIEGFDWDEGNSHKNEHKHGVAISESEQVFANEPLIVASDPRHSESEPRFNALGRTNEGRFMHVTFTLRDGARRLRVISARDMSRKERVVYAQKT